MRSFGAFALAGLTAVATTVAFGGAPSAATADDGPDSRGEVAPAPDALPGARRVAWATTATTNLTVAAEGGYGFIEGADGENGDHHRASGTFGVGLRPLPWLAFAAGASGYWDVHPNDDVSGVGYPWLVARAGGEIADGVAIGGDVRWDVHGAQAPSFEPLASRLTLRALLTVRPIPGLTLGAAAGLRLDGTGRSVDRTGPPFQSGDLVSLDATDSDAVVIGLAAAYRAESVEVYGEVTWEPLFGDAAPSIGQSPLRIAAGFRARLVGGLAAQIGAEATLQSREPVDFARLVEVEPRISVLAGLSYRFDFGSEGTPVEEHEEETIGPEAGEERARIVDPDGAPVAGATVRLLDPEGATAATATSDADGAVSLTPTGPGPFTIEVEAEGYEPHSAPLAAADATGARDVALTRVTPMGTLRGLVRDFRGHAVRASIRLADGTSVEADEDGVFDLNVAAGEIEVTVEASGYATQTRTVTVEAGGVVILNVDLRRE